jgi:hypothetical protein
LYRKNTVLFTQKQQQFPLCTGKIRFSSHKNSAVSSLYRKNNVLFTQKQQQYPLCTGKILFSSQKTAAVLFVQEKYCSLHTKTASEASLHRKMSSLFTQKQQHYPLCTGKMLSSYKNSRTGSITSAPEPHRNLYKDYFYCEQHLKADYGIL